MYCGAKKHHNLPFKSLGFQSNEPIREDFEREGERESRRRLTGLGARKDDNFLHTGCLFHKVMLVVAKEFLSHRPFSALCVAAYPLLMKLGLHGIRAHERIKFRIFEEKWEFL